jgi:hypothetical protein
MKMDEIYFNEYKNPIYKIVNNPRPNMHILLDLGPNMHELLKPRVNSHELLLDQGQVLHGLLDSLGMLGMLGGALKNPCRTTHFEIT